MNLILLAVLMGSTPPACSDVDYRATWQDGYEWRKVLPATKSIHWEVVPAEHLNAICKVSSKGWQAHGCAQWGPEVCVIWAQKPASETPEWLRCHEVRHCNGWVHIDRR